MDEALEKLIPVEEDPEPQPQNTNVEDWRNPEEEQRYWMFSRWKSDWSGGISA